MNYRIVPFTDDVGLEILAYRIDLRNGMILLVPKSLIDSGSTTIEAEVKSFLESLS